MFAVSDVSDISLFVKDNIIITYILFKIRGYTESEMYDAVEINIWIVSKSFLTIGMKFAWTY